MSRSEKEREPLQRFGRNSIVNKHQKKETAGPESDDNLLKGNNPWLQSSLSSILGKEFFATDLASRRQNTRKGSATLPGNTSLGSVSNGHKSRRKSVGVIYTSLDPNFATNCGEDPEIMDKDADRYDSGGAECHSVTHHLKDEPSKQKAPNENIPIRLRRLKLSPKLQNLKQGLEECARESINCSEPRGNPDASSTEWNLKQEPKKEGERRYRKHSLPSLSNAPKAFEMTSRFRKLSNSQQSCHSNNKEATSPQPGFHRGVIDSPSMNRSKSRLLSEKERHLSLPSHPALNLRVHDFLTKAQPKAALPTLRTTDATPRARRCGVSSLPSRPAPAKPAVNTDTCPALTDFQDRSWYYQDKSGKCGYLRVPESPIPPIEWIFERINMRDETETQLSDSD